MDIDFKKILCPVDLSSFSLEALELAAKLGAVSDATLYILHVIDNPFDEMYMTRITQADPASIELYKQEPLRRSKIMKATVEHSEVMVKQFCHDTVEHLAKVRYLVSSGVPFEKILDAAEDHRIDLIVLATHGRTGIKRLLIGNVAERVVRHAPCPVLTVKPRAASRKPRKAESRLARRA
jgi:nucleotide-binding universal stress UspA family protein